MRLRVLTVVGLCAVWSAPSWAQQGTATAMTTYYRCNQATEQRADAIFKEHVAPLYAKQVEAGHLTSYGWARHWLGGEWRRLEYFIGTDVDTMVDARDAVIQELEASHKAAVDEFYGICSSHDDYVWGVAASSQDASTAGTNRGQVGVSTYFQCGDHESEADAIVNLAIAPEMKKHIDAGKIASWSWLRHEIGGRYRRALIIDTASHKAAVGYWSGIAATLGQAQPEMMRRFNEICPSHTDYIWDLSMD